MRTNRSINCICIKNLRLELNKNLTAPFPFHKEDFLAGYFFTVSFVTAVTSVLMVTVGSGHFPMAASTKQLWGWGCFASRVVLQAEYWTALPSVLQRLFWWMLKNLWKHFYSVLVLLLILSIHITPPFSCWLWEFSPSEHTKTRMMWMSAPSCGSLPTASICAPTAPFSSGSQMQQPYSFCFSRNSIRSQGSI